MPVHDQLATFAATWATTRLIRRSIGLSGVRSLQDLVDIVAAKRGRPITLVEVPLPAEVSGFCARGRDRDYIVVDAGAGELTRLHVSLHELFHLWEEHPADDTLEPLVPDEAVRHLFPGLKPEPVQKVLGRLARQVLPELGPGPLQVFGRSHYRKSHERRAETFATVMLQRHLELRTQERRTDYVTSALAHRRTGV
ncbi:hypothetical protein [Streptomyces sp. NPDC093094]|uniref:hypothetical protein n=1 Tax=Streptomyces sp. NPDC093094 TaxID=3366026 RepID=UPI0038267A52